jgi:hypothetical protein
MYPKETGNKPSSCHTTITVQMIVQATYEIAGLLVSSVTAALNDKLSEYTRAADVHMTEKYRIFQ